MLSKRAVGPTQSSDPLAVCPLLETSGTRFVRLAPANDPSVALVIRPAPARPLQIGGEDKLYRARDVGARLGPDTGTHFETWKASKKTGACSQLGLYI
ncbi:uncharacterized protein EHS24_002418 [Apiotrichum porosum]|uniref:Uncharacterized protein n=1 Tax=Apiotrichum porosum TaxID=105984 RepID=A0A427XIF2_9TREE|nr:uncharacterized protein EHS24_002418 [Apiotrichum porosum]RSH78689.1 hypothetical protein EHS24_002418 [Apiotrichum porosum]